LPPDLAAPKDVPSLFPFRSGGFSIFVFPTLFRLRSKVESLHFSFFLTLMLLHPDRCGKGMFVNAFGVLTIHTVLCFFFFLSGDRGCQDQMIFRPKCRRVEKTSGLPLPHAQHFFFSTPGPIGGEFLTLDSENCDRYITFVGVSSLSRLSSSSTDFLSFPYFLFCGDSHFLSSVTQIP